MYPDCWLSTYLSESRRNQAAKTVEEKLSMAMAKIFSMLLGCFALALKHVAMWWLCSVSNTL